jgi:hypothetical protein
MIKAIILILYMTGSVLCANQSKEHKDLTYDASVILLQSIDSDAIILGTGQKVLYVFIDPLCPHSRKFMSMVSKNPIMLSKYQYHILLYSIPRLKSTDVVSGIYMSDNPIKSLLEIMVENKKLDSKGNELTKEKVNRITVIAEEIGVYKRPYIFNIK